MKNLKFLLENINLPINIPTLWKVFEQLIQSKKLNSIKQNKLNVSIESFSYNKEYHKDNSSNGGGFVLDCSCLTNKGSYEAYKKLKGVDKEVIDFLEKEKEEDDD